jgi:hypothetical protein
MTYASGGLIEASDFNNIVGGSSGTQGGGTQLNPVWAQGNGDYGYGQTAVGNVSVSGSVAATNWASLVNSLNSARLHQSGSGSGISAPTAGTSIAFLSTLTSAVSTSATNRLSRNATGSFSALTKAVTLNAGANASATGQITFTITLSSGIDATRHFFNAGGQIEIYYSAFTNTGGTSRGTSIQTLAQTNFATKNMLARSFSARSGTGGTVITDTTASGFYNLPNTLVTRCEINSTSYYTGDFIRVEYSAAGGAGTGGGGNGNVMTVRITAFSATTGSTQPADTINVSLTMGCNVRFPSTTYLSNSWGSATIA